MIAGGGLDGVAAVFGIHVLPQHHPQFDIDEEVLPLGAAMLAEVASTAPVHWERLIAGINQEPLGHQVAGRVHEPGAQLFHYFRVALADARLTHAQDGADGGHRQLFVIVKRQNQAILFLEAARDVLAN